ncbi:BNR-4 repeat-containing protein [Haloferula sp. A504]|uniref:BNR-4 repeat-containing protein n=1 Tax=Haloferula sp. A504 TaxID=3373601 RepID=UPI0031C5FC1A|nr:BNR-4 repeat-containing protein [Verrucomicrobiaceae bacterium E54]
MSAVKSIGFHAFALLAFASFADAETLFSEDFKDSGGTDLNGTTPNTTTGGETWTAGTTYKADGSFGSGRSTATLSFTPVDGFVYTLEASIGSLASTNENWLAFGFAYGESTLNSSNSRFISNNVAPAPSTIGDGSVTGVAWMFARGSGATAANSAFRGSDPTVSSGNAGIADGAAWSTAGTTFGGNLDMRIVLDTTGGTGNWTAAWFADTGSGFVAVRGEETLLTETINSVGFAVTDLSSGQINSFSLTRSGGGSDTDPPVVIARSPGLGAGNVGVDSNVSITFNEVIVKGSGNITILRSADDSVVEAFDVASSLAVSIVNETVMVETPSDFEPNTEYYVQISDTAILDGSGNAFAGISDNSWNFTTQSASTASLAPYSVDLHTLHLWHFDEADPGPAAPAAGVVDSFSLTPSAGAVLGAAAYPGFGNAGDVSAAADAGFQGSVIPVGDVTGPDGAFTFEALVRIANVTDLQQIITMENASGNAADRPFQFRIDGGNLRFINVSAGSQSILGTIPTTGDHAFVANEWFHVAVAYDGNAGTVDNLKLFWTRVDPVHTEANEIASDTMTSDLGGIATTFGVGQEYRSPSDNLEGRIDEVRISSIARGAGDFLFVAPDTDGDGLADPWEILHFRESPGETEAEILAKYDGDDDPDLDTYDNEAEETAGTDPNDPNHTPFDADRDGYEDAWELATFGTTAYGPADDPDGDGFTTAEELIAGTDPANGLSDPDDTDADGLDDDLERSLFGGLGQGPQDDFDGDGIGNLAELNAGTDPTDATDFPLVSLIPVTDGNENTDENGYAGSAINSIAFAQNNLITVGDQQFISYYRRHATDASHPDNNTVVVGRRTLGEAQWEIFSTDFVSFNINDTHNVISCAIDGDGILHMAWGVHGHPLLYARSDAPVTGAAPINMVSLGTAGMTGQENGVTYPKFQTLPDGDVVFLYREGGSGSGDWYLHRYDIDTDTWAPIHANGSGIQQPLMLGRGDSPDNCFYPDRLTLGPDGMLHMAGVFRYNADSQAGQSGYQTNHRYVYLRSPDGGTNWERSDGSTLDLPVVEAAWFQNLGAAHVPEIVKDLPEGHSIMNESGMTTDSAGRPIIANWWADNASTGDHTRQYHIFFHDGTEWHQRTVSARAIDNPATKYSESQLGSSKMGRPVVLTDADDRILVVYNDNRFDGITVVFSLPLAQDPDRLHWTRMNITSENVGNWETTYDEERWKRDGVLQMLYQKLPGMGMSFTGQNNSTPVSVVEWNARAYFNSPIRWNVDMASTPGQAKVTARTRAGFRYDLRTSTNLDFSDPPAESVPGDGSWLELGTWPTNEPRRFWQLERVEQATNDL